MSLKLVIDNSEIDAEGGKKYIRHHPVSGEEIVSCSAASISDVKNAVKSSHSAYVKWSRTTPMERRDILLAAASNLEKKADTFVDIMKNEIGANELWARFNVSLASGVFREAASLVSQVQGETLPSNQKGLFSMTVRKPLGVCLSIVPWNGPVVLAARAIAYPMAFGNTVLFKASETSPGTHRLVAEALYEAGLPPGVLNFITIHPDDSPEVVEAIIADTQVRHVNFTGSTTVGKIIGQAAGKYLKRCLLELGDKSPLVVLDDADIDKAVSAAVFGAFLYQGQICMSTDRIVIDSTVADVFVSKFVQKSSQLPVGDPGCMAESIVGPVVSNDSRIRLNSLVEDAISKGGKVVLGGKSDSAVYWPTIIDHVDSSMKIFTEETFGPVVSVIRVDSEADAIDLINSTNYGLSASVFSSDIVRALRVATDIETGSCHINGATVQNESCAPYGGTKASGYGKFDGRAVIDEFTELQWITIEDGSQGYPF